MSSWTRFRNATALASCLLWAGVGASSAQEFSYQRANQPLLSFYGMPGMVDMPTGVMLPDAEVTGTFSYYSGRKRTALGFQIAPWLFASYQYSISDFGDPVNLYDRAFGLSARLWKENAWRPSIAIGINDMAGTSVFASEYISATKTFEDRLKVTAGIGWGRLGSYNGFKNPLSYINDSFETRPETDFGEGGTFESGQWFRGPAALFGGVEWKLNDQWTAILEYSSDAYEREVDADVYEHNTPINLGLHYRPSPGINIGAYALNGSTIGITASFTANPKAPPFRDGRETAPPPVSPRAGGTVDLAAWNLPSRQLDGQSEATIRAQVATAFEADGLTLEGFEIEGDSARVAFAGIRYNSRPQALGRASRILAAMLPSHVETFVLQPLVFGQGTSSITIVRSDLEDLEAAPDRIWKSYVRAEIEDAGDLSFSDFVADAYPQHRWYARPYFAPALFDPDDPLRADVGIDVGGSYAPLPGLVLSANYRQKLFGNRDESTRESDSVLQHVRSDVVEYDKNGASYISHLTAEYFFRPGKNIYGRTTAGLLERMYGGISAELLWKPTEGPLALGGELNYVVQRDFEGGFGFQDYDVMTGHLSAYYELGGGYFGQVDAGKYLAGDYGATLQFSRDFNNGVRLGAFATFTDVSYDDFGEGSFDKGIFVEVPFAWLSGVPSRQGFATAIRPIQRDGGARLAVRNRLYPTVKTYQDPELRERWAGYWR
ncbi:YjbH domain-containing protein [Tropicimonas sp. TH_r6]|uniref:YjbH domain-containing protein n=1 Tax=Tropicimonas sp. TH_r6 TaxID=3082085 RepID=UPI0029534B8B|nr:YjbH domain-containing protein [Tropicimonas sp. TH_r6]MDV7141369.1 YjbH domain-containing protein [Tropicimonas sp. TH_r6]